MNSYNNLKPEVINDLNEDQLEGMLPKDMDYHYLNQAEKQRAEWLNKIEESVQKSNCGRTDPTLCNALLNLVGFIREEVQLNSKWIMLGLLINTIAIVLLAFIK